jgi:NAD(P)-dependent dehydrogenase (short-subunit alcohol dehydrogenase family)
MAKVLIVGSNRGIGLELVRQFAARGDSVWAACRKASDSLKDVKNVTIVENIDIAKVKSSIIQVFHVENKDEAVEQIRSNATFPDAFDVVIANAGLLNRESFDDLPCSEGILNQFNINAIGPLRVAKGVEGRLKAGAKFNVITSRMGSITDNGSGGMYGYRMSKSALNAAATSLMHDFKKVDVSVGIIHPGYVRTGNKMVVPALFANKILDMTGNNGMINADESAEGIIKRIDELNIEKTGTFWHMNGEVLPW